MTDVHKRAQEYVDSVLESQRRAGHEPKLSKEEYEEAVNRAAEGFEGLTDRDERDEDAVPA
jgi:hypothetical protein